MAGEPLVGVLALQGDFAEHAQALAAFGVATRYVRRARDLVGLSGIVLPGGESSTMLKLLAIQDLEAPLGEFLRSGRPVLATCAGLILCARKVVAPEQRSYGVLDIEVARNGWGRQIASGTFALAVRPGKELPTTMSGVFIRAPRILGVGKGCEVLATRDGEAVLVRQGPVLGASFHPELEFRHPVMESFVRMLVQPHAQTATSD